MTKPSPLETAKDNINGMALTEDEVTLVCQAFIAQTQERDHYCARIEQFTAILIGRDAELKEARAVIEFYGSALNWDINLPTDKTDYFNVICSGDMSVPEELCDERGGKRAKEWLAKWKEEK